MGHLNQRILFSYSKHALCIILFFVLLHYTIIAEEDRDDTAVMSNLLESLNPTPYGWSNNTYFCSWTGITCGGTAGNRVTAIQLSRQSLTGILPSNLNSLSYLAQLDLSHNNLTGPVPSLANLQLLQNVNLEFNNFTSVPDGCFHGLFSLQVISMSSNFNLAPWTFLTSLVMIDHQYSSVLDSIYFDFTNMEGNLPDIFHSFPRLRYLVLHGNNLTGVLPKSLGQTLTDLKALNLSGNNLTGSIPASLVTLSQLETLDLSYNDLSGEVPIFPTRVKLNITGNPFLYFQRHPTFPFVWVAGALAITIVGFLMFMVIVYNRKRCASLVTKGLFKKARTYSDDNVENFMKRYSSLVPKLYSYKEIKKMTKSFHHKIGQGGFGIVYKGCLDDGRHVAVKVISESKGSGEEFMNEVISISRTSHVNIVSLLGFCYEKNKRALIYEFMLNGSLDKFIHRKGSPNTNCDLDLNILYKIAIGIAQGLEYLHRGCSTRIVHLDIKPQNILLDEYFCSKISDFGLAILCKRRESIISLLGARGTIGYIAPEILTRRYGGVSHKSDVYSYGMLILEIIGGKNHEYRKLQASEIFLPEIIYENLVQDNIRSSHFPIIEEEAGILKKMIMISLWCIQMIPTNRPCITKVIEMLEGPLELVPFPPKPTSYSPNIVAPLQFLEVSSKKVNSNASYYLLCLY